MGTAWKIYEVEVSGYGTAIHTGKSSGQARAEAFRSDAFSHLTFRQFLGISRVRRVRTPLTDDGYGYVRRAYDVSPHIGQRVRLQNEGSYWNGRLGTVIYPGPSTAHVRVVMDGESIPVSVHPLNVVLLEEGTS